MQLSIREGVTVDLWFVKGKVKVDLDKRNVNKMIQNKDLLEWILEITEFLDFYYKGEQTSLFSEDVFVHWGNDLRGRLVMQQEKGAF